MCNKTLRLGKLIACCSVTRHKWVSWLRFWATRIYGSRTGFLVLPFWGSDHLAIPPFVMIGHHLYYLNPFEHFETYRFEVLKPRNVPRTSLFLTDWVWNTFQSRLSGHLSQSTQVKDFIIKLSDLSELTQSFYNRGFRLQSNESVAIANPICK